MQSEDGNAGSSADNSTLGIRKTLQNLFIRTIEVASTYTFVDPVLRNIEHHIAIIFTRANILVSIALCLLRANRFQYVTFQPRLSRERCTAGIRLYTIYIRHTLLDIPIADRESLPGQYGLIVVLVILSHKVFRDRSTCESVSIGTIVSTGPKIVTFNTFNPTCGFYPQVHLREFLYRVRNIHFESLLFTHFAM